MTERVEINRYDAARQEIYFLLLPSSASACDYNHAGISRGGFSSKKHGRLRKGVYWSHSTSQNGNHSLPVFQCIIVSGKERLLSPRTSIDLQAAAVSRIPNSHRALGRGTPPGSCHGVFPRPRLPAYLNIHLYLKNMASQQWTSKSAFHRQPGRAV